MNAPRTAIDHTALGWIKPELDTLLQQARIELEAYAERPTDTAALRACAQALQQVRGSLRMLDLDAGSLLADEMHRVALALGEGGAADTESASATLMSGLVLLPDYLERLQGGHRDVPLVLLPLIDELRAARGEGGFDEGTLAAMGGPEAPTEAEIAHARAALGGRNRALLDTVSSAVKEDLMQVKDALDLHLRGSHRDVASLAPHADMLGRIADTLGMIGLDRTAANVARQRDALRAIAGGSVAAEEGPLLDIAGALLHVDASLDEQVARMGDRDEDGIDDALASESRRVTAVLMREATHNLALVREGVLAYIHSGGNAADVAEAPRLLGEIGGALRILEQPHAADLVTGVRAYMRDALDDGAGTPDADALDRLADAVTSLDMYLENLASGAKREDLLDFVRSSLATLQYWPLPDSARRETAAPAPATDAADDLAADATAESTQAASIASEDAVAAAKADAAASALAAPPVMVEAAPHAAVSAAASGFDAASDEIDDEIREVFLEEFEEEIDNLGELLPVWRKQPDDLELVRTIRRVFHTLKGSGRLVGARLLGEFSWKIENMLNRVLDGSRAPTPAVLRIVEQAHASLPQLHAALRGEGAVTADLEALEQIAERVAAGEEVQLGATAPAPAQAIDEPAPSAAQPALEDEDDDGIATSVDPVLLEILDAEVTGHLQSIERWLSQSHASAHPDESLLRALHTSNGAFAMTDVPAITDLLAPAEGYVKRLMSAGQAADDAGIAAIADVAGAVSDTISALRGDAPRVRAVPELAARLRALRDALPEPHAGQLSSPQTRAMPDAVEPLPAGYDGLSLEPLAGASVESLRDDHARIAADQQRFDQERADRDAEARAETERLAAQQAEAELLEAERIAFERAEAERLEAERLEAERVEEAARLDAERVEAERIEAERLESERVEAERIEAERVESERVEAERVEFERIEAERLESERLESERIEAERIEAERLEAERIEAERLAAEQAEAQRLADEEAAEYARLEAEYAEQNRLQAEAERLAAEQAEAERVAAAEHARQEAEARIAAERAEAERLAAEHSEADRLAAELAERERQEEEARIAAARAEAERVAAEQAEADRLAAEQAEADRLAAEQAEAERLAAEQAEAERVAAEQAEVERVAAEQAEAERLAAEQAEADRLAAEQAEAERLVAEQAESERVAAEQAEAERLAAEQAEARRIEAERRAAQEAEARRAAQAKAEAERAERKEREEQARVAAFLASAASAAAAEDPDEALDLTGLDPELVDLFIEEARDLLDHSDGLLAKLRDAPESREPVAGLQRDLHTLKGGARMAGVMAVGELGHAMESLLEAVAAQKIEVGRGDVPLLERGFDRLHNMVVRVGARRAIGMPAQLIGEFDARARGESLAGAGPKVELKPLSAPIGEGIAADDDEIGVRAPQEQVRIRADLLDRLVNYAGEVAIYRARLEQQLGAFRAAMFEMEQTNARLRDQLRRLDAETEAQIIARYQREQDVADPAFDPLELDRFSTLQQLSRALAESAADMSSLQGTLDDLTRQYETLLLQQSRVSSDLQEGLMRTRMVPFDALVPRLRRVVRQAATDTGKQVQLKLDGAHGELDRNVLERMTAPLEHMLRNAVAHGLEDPDGRRRAKKREEGTVRVAVRREGSEVVLEVGDDGAGLDRVAIRRRAEERGLLREGAVLADVDLDVLIMEPGFSTADEVSRLAGRGVGMDVVASEVRQLGGTLDIASRVGEGTRFILRLPQTLAVTQAVFVRIGETSFAVPIASVRGVGRISRDELAAGGSSYRYGGEDYALHDLGLLLGHAAARAEGQTQMPLLLIRSGELRAAVAIDQVIGNREIVVKPVGPQVASVPGIFGATIMGDGRVVVILDIAPLVRRHAALPRDADHAQTPGMLDQGVRRVPLVMVVDDSITMRKVTGRVLERHNLEVVTAKDGVDALERLEERVPDLMLLDIEMPRMDGYELATHMKADARLRNVPIVMITSRTGDKHRQRAFEIGVQRYLGKPYQEPELMRNVFELLGVEPARDEAG